MTFLQKRQQPHSLPHEPHNEEVKREKEKSGEDRIRIMDIN